MKDLTGYELSRDFFNWSFENPEKISPTHVALYFFIIEHSNRMGWKEKFGLPTTMAKEAIGIRNYKTYAKTLADLVEWGFIIMIEKSKNQYSSNIVALVKNTKAHTEALTKASPKHVPKQVQSIASINKLYNRELINLKEENNFEKIKIESNRKRLQDLKTEYETKIGDNESGYVKFINYLLTLEGSIDHILLLNQLVTFENYCELRLMAKNKGKAVRDKLDFLVNTPSYLQNKKSLYLTLRGLLTFEK